MKTILGLDLGTNSIGWALIEIDHVNKTLKIIGLGSRIIPMDSQEFSKYNAGVKIDSASGKRTTIHRARITKERYLLRRDRLHLVLNLLEALPEHYKIDLDLERGGKKCGQFKEGTEPKIAYLPTKNSENKQTFYFEDAFNEMILDLQKINPEIKNEKKKRVSKDWVIYYLRNKALKDRITLEELAWVLLSYNQKRGASSDEIEEDNNEKSDEFKEKLDLTVLNAEPKTDENGNYFEIQLNDSENFTYKEYTNEQLTFKDDVKEVVKISKLDDAGNVITDKTVYQINDLCSLKLESINYTETDDKTYKHIYNFKYSNGWNNEKKKQKFDKSYFKLEKQLSEEKKVIQELYVISNIYDINGTPEKIIPKIKLPDFNSEGSKDWTLLKKKSEKDAIKFNIENGFINKDKSAKHYISPKIYDVLKNDAKTGERTKIIGGLFQTIDRKFYREELNQIIETQRKFHNTLDDKTVFEKCVKLLYPNNEEHAKMLFENKNAITNLIVEDLLLYQRPLKSKKSEISNCKYEIDFWKENIDESTGEVTENPVYKKVVSVSHPLFQEFRIWDKIHNIKLIQLESKSLDGKTETNVDVTSKFFNQESYWALFNHFNNRKTVGITDFLDFCKREFKIDIGKKEERKFLWNYPIEEEFKGNETRKSFEMRFNRCGFKDFGSFMTQQKEIELWHYLYSVDIPERKKLSNTKDEKNPKFGKTGIQNFFTNYFKDFEIEEKVFENICNDFQNYPKFPSKYSAYSYKALNKLLSVMRAGESFISAEKFNEKWQEKYLERTKSIIGKVEQIDWTQKDIDYENIIDINVNSKKDELPFPKGLINTFKNFNSLQDFHFLNLTQASYLIYGRHSELAQAKFWDSPQKIREEINKELIHNSLNNPVAEKVIKETMKVVADIWEYYGKSEKKFFTEIHLEVARELQKNNKDKKAISDWQKNSRKENDRLKNILEDFLNNSKYNAKKGNSDHFERLKIVEEGVINRSNLEKDFYEKNKDKFERKEIEIILKKQKISKDDFEKYKLWIEQGYRSPYTNLPIKLTDLFNGSLYNVDHIFPRASITNDSLSNKVVCEKEINKEKSNLTGRAFIENFQNQEFNTIAKGKVKIITEEEYVYLVKSQFRDAKRLILLAKEVPSGFTESQMNNTKYIARKAMELLSHIVREEGEIEFRSKNVLPVTGAITDILKKEWKLNQVWSELLTPRFERLNKIHNSKDFGDYSISKNGHKYFDINTKFILDKNDKFELKRIDHRHHALDALIIALCTQNHVQYINNINSGITNKKKDKIEAIKKQRAGIKRTIMYSEKDKENPNEKVWRFMLPGSFRDINSENNDIDSVIDVVWKNAYTEKDYYKKIILESLQNCIVSFKNDFKTVSKSSNKYESYYDENGNLRLDGNGKPKKEFISQKNANNKHWSIRKPLHTDNPSAEINLQTDRFKIIDKLGIADLIIDESIKDAVKELLGMFDGKIGEAKKYLAKNPILINDEIIEVTDFRSPNIKYRKRQPITELSKRTGTGALKTLDEVKNRIYKVADIKLRNDLLKHLSKNDNDIDLAFSIEGIEDFNKSRKIPVYRLPIAESGSLKFKIGNKNKNNHQWVETGGNFHFKITEKDGVRDYETIPLREAIEIEKEKLINKSTIESNTDTILSPNDLVYVPTELELENPNSVDFSNLTLEQKRRVYKLVSTTEKEAHFIPYSNSTEIIKNENGTNSKSERIQNFYDDNAFLDSKGKEIQIKSVCWKLNVDRLGNISKA